MIPPVQALIERGVTIHAPQSVWIDASIRPARIAPGVIIHPGCRLAGADTSIGPDCELGREAPLTLDDCQLARGVRLHGGYLAGATCLDEVVIASGAHIRPGTLLEERVACGHAVGLKQTLLMPCVTTGSLINFCDALMAGGTGRHNHSEIGSSYVHFNFTPHGDKATPSLVGDVPHGVMLNQPPIFLGGQGGLVGPCRIAYGTLAAAGTILRRDVTEPGRRIGGGAPDPSTGPFQPGARRGLRRVLAGNLRYIGNLRALAAWYRHVRRRWMSGDPYAAACHAGALTRIDAMLAERLHRLADVMAGLPRSLELGPSAGTAEAELNAQLTLFVHWSRLAPALRETVEGDTAARATLLDALDDRTPYLEAIPALPPAARTAGTAWLQSIVDATVRLPA